MLLDNPPGFSMLAFRAGKALLSLRVVGAPKIPMKVTQMPFVQRRSSQWKKGYTLVEVLFAILIASITAGVLFTAFDNGFALLRTTREDLRATEILLQRTEAVRLFTWQDLTNSATTFTEYYSPSSSGTLTNKGTLYTITVDPLGTPPFSYSGDLHLVTITVSWADGKTGLSHSRQMQTLSAQYGMQGFLE